jgi:hypothetical protein
MTAVIRERLVFDPQESTGVPLRGPRRHGLVEQSCRVRVTDGSAFTQQRTSPESVNSSIRVASDVAAERQV